jgi:hypothetical protein
MVGLHFRRYFTADRPGLHKRSHSALQFLQVNDYWTAKLFWHSSQLTGGLLVGQISRASFSERHFHSTLLVLSGYAIMLQYEEYLLPEDYQSPEEADRQPRVESFGDRVRPPGSLVKFFKSSPRKDATASSRLAHAWDRGKNTLGIHTNQPLACFRCLERLETASTTLLRRALLALSSCSGTETISSLLHMVRTITSITGTLNPAKVSSDTLGRGF